MVEKNILIGEEAIKKFIGITSRELFADFIKLGMPAALIKNRWYAHKENIDKFFKLRTNRITKTIPPDAK